MSKYYCYCIISTLGLELEGKETIMTNLLFTPILKTKRESEITALKTIKPLLANNQLIIPYIECNKELKDKIVINYIDVLENNTFFIEPIHRDIVKLIETSFVGNENLSIVYKIVEDSTKKEIIDFIKYHRKANKKVYIKIADGDSRFLDELQNLLPTDILFIDIRGNNYTSVRDTFIGDISKTGTKCRIIIHSNERSEIIPGKMFADYNYNPEAFFNLSVINAIKSGQFTFDGFGSRCAAKDDNTEDIRRSNKAVGYLLIFDYDKNNFFSVISDGADHVSRIYKLFI